MSVEAATRQTLIDCPWHHFSEACHDFAVLKMAPCPTPDPWEELKVRSPISAHSYPYIVPFSHRGQHFQIFWVWDSAKYPDLS